MRRQQGFVLILGLLLVLVVGTSFLLAAPSNVASRYGQRAADQERELLNTNFMQQMTADQQRRAGNEVPIADAAPGGEGE